MEPTIDMVKNLETPKNHRNPLQQIRQARPSQARSSREVSGPPGW